MTRNIEKHLQYLKGYELTPDQEREIIEALYGVAEAVVDLAFRRHSSQLLQAANDNDSPNAFNVIEFFQHSANDPALDQYADLLKELEARQTPILKTKRS